MNPVPFQESLANVFNPFQADGVTPTQDWQEVLDVNSPAESHFGADGQQEAALTGLIPYNKQRSAVRWFLGFASVTQNVSVLGVTLPIGGGSLSRENPCPHPQFPQLRASSVSFKPYVPKVVATGTTLGIPSNFALNLQPDFPSAVINPISGGGSSIKNLQYGSYAKTTAAVKFSSFRFSFLEDNAINQVQTSYYARAGKAVPAGSGMFEWRRNTWVDTAPRLDILSADGVSQMAFAEGSPAIVGPPAAPAGPTGPYSTPATQPTAFPAPIGIPTAKCDFTVNWYNVPYNYLTKLSDTVDVLFPQNILNCIGKVNSVTFMETFDPETVLLKGASFDTKVFLVPAVDGTPMLSVDVKLMFDYFNPKKGNPTSTYKGWQLLPYRVNGLWYYAVRSNPPTTVLGVTIPGSLNTTPLLPEIDMNTVFDNPNYLPNSP